MLGDRHQFDMGKSKLLAVIHDASGNVAVVHPSVFTIRIVLPAAGVHKPVFVIPLVGVQVRDNRSGAGGNFAEETVGVRFFYDVTVGIGDAELVFFAKAHLWNKQFPDFCPSG